MAISGFFGLACDTSSTLHTHTHDPIRAFDLFSPEFIELAAKTKEEEEGEGNKIQSFFLLIFHVGSCNNTQQRQGHYFPTINLAFRSPLPISPGEELLHGGGREEGNINPHT